MKERASGFALVCSFIMPIVGVICYFVQKDNVENPNSYLKSAFWGFVLGILLNVMASCAIVTMQYM